jgi:UDP-N-acetylbacillosamine N-acetyltransferase
MDVIIFGASDFAKLIRNYFENHSSYNIIGYSVDDEYVKECIYDGLELIPRSQLFKYKSSAMIFIALGYKNMRARATVYNELRNDCFRFASFISPFAIVDPSAIIGDNVIVLHGAVIEPFAYVGNNSFINSSVTLCHHSFISEHCFIAANSIIGGYTKVCDNCFIGFNSTVVQKILIGEETLIAASSTVLESTLPNSKYVGTPAKFINEHIEFGIKIVE